MTTETRTIAGVICDPSTFYDKAGARNPLQLARSACVREREREKERRKIKNECSSFGVETRLSR